MLDVPSDDDAGDDDNDDADIDALLAQPGQPMTDLLQGAIKRKASQLMRTLTSDEADLEDGRYFQWLLEADDDGVPGGKNYLSWTDFQEARPKVNRLPSVTTVLCPSLPILCSDSSVLYCVLM